MRITFIGLGMMGKPMAINLLKAGHDLTVVNRSQGKVQELAEMGATPGTTPAEASRDADVICTCLVGDDVVEQVIAGDDGVLAGARSGAVLLDHSTVHPEFAKRMEAACAAKGVTYLDAPVSGTGQVAWDGKLTVMVGGYAGAFERVKPALGAVSTNAALMGAVGTGNFAKLVNNMVKDVAQLVTMETFVLGTALGMDPGALFAVLRTASANSRQLERIVPKILDRSFTQSSYVTTNIKDQGLMRWLSEQAGTKLPMREACEATWIAAREAGVGDKDPTEAIRVLERQAGFEVAGVVPDAGEEPPSPDAARGVPITFIGLGLMGRPMAENLVKKGLDVTVINRSQGKVQELAAMGAKAGTTPAAAAAASDVVCLCLQGEEIVEQVLTADDGVLATARPGTIVVDHSTLHPEDAKRLAAICAAKGVTYLDAPVSGTGKVAWDGRLTIMVGGDAAAFERVRPILSAVSIHARLLGPVGSGNITKLLNNLIGDVNQIGVMEAFVLGANLGMDLDALFAVMRTASAASRQLERIGPKILARDFVQTSHLAGHLENQGRTRWLCEQVGLQLPLRDVSEEFWRRGVEAGYGPGDPVKSIELIEGDAGGRVAKGAAAG